MNREHAYFEYQKAILHFSKYGDGAKILLCFHGYGQSNNDMNVLQEALKEKYTIYTFDLFYHGESFWHQKEKPLTKIFWFELINAFLTTYNVQRFSLAGFSMGAKFVLPIVESFSERIDKLLLIAPDGITINVWYRIATSFNWTRALLRSLVVKPDWYLRMIKMLIFFKLAPTSVINLANSKMVTRRQRRRVYYSWVVFRVLRVNSKDIGGLINKYNIQLMVFLGSRDKLITEISVRPLLRHTINYQKIILKAGHTNLLQSVADYERNNNIV